MPARARRTATGGEALRKRRREDAAAPSTRARRAADGQLREEKTRATVGRRRRRLRTRRTRKFSHLSGKRDGFYSKTKISGKSQHWCISGPTRGRIDRMTAQHAAAGQLQLKYWAEARLQRWGHIAVPLSSTRVAIHGGYGRDGKKLRRLDDVVIVSSDGTVAPTASSTPRPKARERHGAAAGRRRLRHPRRPRRRRVRRRLALGRRRLDGAALRGVAAGAAVVARLRGSPRGRIPRVRRPRRRGRPR